MICHIWVINPCGIYPSHDIPCPPEPDDTIPTDFLCVSRGPSKTSLFDFYHIVGPDGHRMLCERIDVLVWSWPLYTGYPLIKLWCTPDVSYYTKSLFSHPREREREHQSNTLSHPIKQILWAGWVARDDLPLPIPPYSILPPYSWPSPGNGPRFWLSANEKSIPSWLILMKDCWGRKSTILSDCPPLLTKCPDPK